MTIEQFIEKYENLLDSKPLDTKHLCIAILSDLSDVYTYDFTQMLLESNVDILSWLKSDFKEVKCFNKDYPVFKFDDYLIENAFVTLDEDFYSNYSLFSVINLLDDAKANLNLRNNRYTMPVRSFTNAKFKSGCISIFRDDSSSPPCTIVLRLQADDQTVYELEQSIPTNILRYLPGIGFGLNLRELRQLIVDLDDKIKRLIQTNLIR